MGFPETSSSTISFLLNWLISCSESEQSNRHKFKEEEAGLEMKASDYNVPQRRRGTSCPQPSSAACRACCSGLVCGSRGRSGLAWSRCPSWSRGPSRPGRRCRSGKRMPAAQTLHGGGGTTRYFTQTQQHARSYSCHSNLSCLQSLLCPAWRCHLLKETLIVILMVGEAVLSENQDWNKATYQYFPPSPRGPGSLSCPGRESAAKDKN